MTPQKKTDEASSRASTATTAVPTTSTTGRKPWVKKTPAEIVLSQLNRQRDNVANIEEELRQAKRQLEKLEAARKVLEGA